MQQYKHSLNLSPHMFTRKTAFNEMKTFILNGNSHCYNKMAHKSFNFSATYNRLCWLIVSADINQSPVNQCQLSVPSLRSQLMNTSKKWGVNGHTTRCTGPVSVILQLRLVSSWGLQETEISAASWALRLRKGLYMFLHFPPLLITQLSVKQN